MIRTKSKLGTGDVVEALTHMRTMNQEIRRIASMGIDELMNAAKELGAPYDLVVMVFS